MKVEKKRNKKIWIFAVVVILVAALGVVFAYKLGQQKSVNNSNFRSIRRWMKEIIQYI